MEFGSSRVKKRGYIIIISAFLLGVATGSLLMNLVVAQTSVLNRPPTAVQELSGELQLNSRQQEQVERIIQTSRGRSQQIQKTIQPELDALRTQMRAEITSLLTPDQQQKYLIWLKKKDALRINKSASK